MNPVCAAAPSSELALPPMHTPLALVEYTTHPSRAAHSAAHSSVLPVFFLKMRVAALTLVSALGQSLIRRRSSLRRLSWSNDAAAGGPRADVPLTRSARPRPAAAYIRRPPRFSALASTDASVPAANLQLGHRDNSLRNCRLSGAELLIRGSCDASRRVLFPSKGIYDHDLSSNSPDGDAGERVWVVLL